MGRLYAERNWFIVSRTETPSERGGSRRTSCLDELGAGAQTTRAANAEKRARYFMMIDLDDSGISKNVWKQVRRQGERR